MQISAGGATSRSLKISAGLPYQWCLQCLPLASSPSPNLLHLYGFEITSGTTEVQLIAECWGKGHLYWSVKIPNQRLRSRRWTVGCIKLKPGGVYLPKLAVVQDLGFFHFIELTKWLYLHSFMYAKVNVKWCQMVSSCFTMCVLKDLTRNLNPKCEQEVERA